MYPPLRSRTGDFLVECRADRHQRHCIAFTPGREGSCLSLSSGAGDSIGSVLTSVGGSRLSYHQQRLLVLRSTNGLKPVVARELHPSLQQNTRGGNNPSLIGESHCLPCQSEPLPTSGGSQPPKTRRNSPITRPKSTSGTPRRYENGEGSKRCQSGERGATRHFGSPWVFKDEVARNRNFQRRVRTDLCDRDASRHECHARENYSQLLKLAFTLRPKGVAPRFAVDRWRCPAVIL